ncbi:MAG: hypothetical protein OJF50_006531 [Nitrospira sp.]|jgi:hypothetical protein|nr:hypothetical protein [Nitrospira sp.]
MTRSIRFLLPDQTAQSSLALPDLIQEASARNPALVTARKQWEAATNRIAQARSLEVPTLSVQLWNFLQARWEVARCAGPPCCRRLSRV